ncbi:MAG: hypothetical protein NTU53_11220 [Planctomycetota bacterium]|nr:hypothetical protein [Planctomycetota bacterium]
MLWHKWHILSALTVSLLLQGASASEKNPVQRPLRAMSDVTVVLDFATSTYESAEEGECAHFGRYVNKGGGVIDAGGNPTSGGGIITTANGDQVFWQMASGRAEITGGSGRFEFATGYMLPGPPQDMQMVWVDDHTLVITYSTIGTGKITY